LNLVEIIARFGIIPPTKKANFSAKLVLDDKRESIYIPLGSRNRIAHNLIHHMPRYGISLKTGSHNNIVEYNEIDIARVDLPQVLS